MARSCCAGHLSADWRQGPGLHRQRRGASGSGPGNGGTLINIGAAANAFIQMRGTGSWQTSGTPATITDTYVPAGAFTFHVSDTRGLSVGDSILIDRPVTSAWIAFMGMDKLVRGGAAQVWLKPGSLVRSDRVIRAIAGNQITIDAPLTDSIDAKYVSPPGATVAK